MSEPLRSFLGPRTQTHCRYCGRELELVEERGLFDVRTGERQTDRYAECPRFRRSWRNFWMGGCHDSIDWDGGLGGRHWA